MTRCIMLYLIMIASVVNLSLGVPPRELWITALTVSLSGTGFVMVGQAISDKRWKSDASLAATLQRR